MFRQLLKPETLAAFDQLHAENARHGETTPDDDLDVLAAILTASRASRILQFGTFLGGSAIVMADLARANNATRAKVVTVDPDPAMNESCRKYAELAGLTPFIQTLDGYSTDPALLLRLRTFRAEYEWDAVFLDTTHQYAQTKAEIAAIAPLCGPSTLFLFHDASRYAADTLDLGQQGGVARALREWCLVNPRWQHFTFEKPSFGQFGIGVMQKVAA